MPALPTAAPQHVRRAVGENRGGALGAPQCLQHPARVGIGLDGAKGLHQALAQRRVLDPEARHGVVEGLAGHLPEIRVRAHQAPEPAVFELARAPERAQRRRLVAEQRRGSGWWRRGCRTACRRRRRRRRWCGRARLMACKSPPRAGAGRRQRGELTASGRSEARRPVRDRPGAGGRPAGSPARAGRRSGSRRTESIRPSR